MKRVGLAEARDNLSGLVNDAAHGHQRIVIESRGRPKAAIVSIEDLQRLDEIGEDRKTARSPMLRWLDETQHALRRQRPLAPGTTLAALREVREEAVAESPSLYRRQRRPQAGRRRRR
jgi:prevent-host-death family protein